MQALQEEELPDVNFQSAMQFLAELADFGQRVVKTVFTVVFTPIRFSFKFFKFLILFLIHCDPTMVAVLVSTATGWAMYEWGPGLLCHGAGLLPDRVAPLAQRLICSTTLRNGSDPTAPQYVIKTLNVKLMDETVMSGMAEELRAAQNLGSSDSGAAAARLAAALRRSKGSLDELHSQVRAFGTGLVAAQRDTINLLDAMHHMPINTVGSLPEWLAWLPLSIKCPRGTMAERVEALDKILRAAVDDVMALEKATQPEAMRQALRLNEVDPLKTKVERAHEKTVEARQRAWRTLEKKKKQQEEGAGGNENREKTEHRPTQPQIKDLIKAYRLSELLETHSRLDTSITRTIRSRFDSELAELSRLTKLVHEKYLPDLLRLYEDTAELWTEVAGGDSTGCRERWSAGTLDYTERSLHSFAETFLLLVPEGLEGFV